MQSLRRLRSRLPASEALWLETRCSEELVGSSLQPVSSLLRRTLNLDPGGSPSDHLAMLSAAVSQMDAEPSEMLPLLGSLLDRCCQLVDLLYAAIDPRIRLA